ncbi:hypothetical protein BC940DRAFT_334628 [Gongronella butleri]|nr:hypothetical protein BC940DRAFT_334628 [Gongronella butleri]
MLTMLVAVVVADESSTSKAAGTSSHQCPKIVCPTTQASQPKCPSTCADSCTFQPDPCCPGVQVAVCGSSSSGASSGGSASATGSGSASSGGASGSMTATSMPSGSASASGSGASTAPSHSMASSMERSVIAPLLLVFVSMLYFL